MIKQQKHSDVSYHVGEKVRITAKQVKEMVDSSRNPKHYGYPCAELIKLAKSVAEVGLDGVVTHLIASRFQVTAKFGHLSLHLKNNWLEKVSA